MAVQLPNFHPLRADLPDAAAMMEFGNLLKMCAFCEQEVQTVDFDQIFLNRFGTGPFSDQMRATGRNLSAIL